MSTEMIWAVRSTGSDDTELLGETFGRLLQAPSVVELRADLGGGKTTFVRGLAAGLGSSDTVSSPTFTISKTYKASKSEIHHFDFYRLNDAGIIKDQLKESLESPDSIIVIEWSDIIKDVLPAKRYIIDINLTSNDADEREISFHYPEDYSSIIKSLETDWARI